MKGKGRKAILKCYIISGGEGHGIYENMLGWGLQAGNPEMGDQAYLVPGADPGSPTKGERMFRENRSGFPSLSPLGGGATSWVACDFLEASSHRRSQMWCLEGDVEDGEELYRDVKEVIDGVFNVEVVEDEV